VLVGIAGTALAVPALPEAHQLRQPDGTTFLARLWGDERLHGWETAEGYAILLDETSGFWHYAEIDASGEARTTPSRPGLDPAPSGVGKGIRLRPVRPERQRAMRAVAPDGLSAPELVVPSTGTGNVPVLLIQFSNAAGTKTAASFNTLLFGSGNFSMADYYEEVSYNQFTVAPGPSGIGGWYTAANTHNYYGTNDAGGNDMWPGDLVWEAANAANNGGFNFAPYDQDGDCLVDNLVVVHQGTGEEAGGPSTDIWSHSWDLYSANYYVYSHYGPLTTSSTCTANPAQKVVVNKYTIQPEILSGTTQITIGVFAHEFGHALGLPDLYDTDGSSQGVGNWSLMASGSWNRQTTSGDRPSHVDPWGKWKLGWISPTAVTCATSVSLPAVESSSAGFYRLLSGSAPSATGEYFLLENRQRTNFDVGLPAAGLLIWHVDEGRANNRAECWPGPGTPPPLCSATQHYKVALVQADNAWNLEKNNNRGDGGDPYRGTSGNTAFTGSSAPNSNIFVGTSGTGGAASGVSVTSISTSAATMTATLEAPGSCLPSVTSFAPTSGPVGTSVAITGERFTGATAVRFNGTASTYTVNSASSISATVPAGATTGPISVTTPAGTGTSSSSFTVTVPCTYSINPTNATPGASGGPGSVSVTAGAGCAWTATSNHPAWLTVTGGSSGTGNGTVSYSVAANSGGARTGTITIAGQTFTVNQAAATCSYSIDPTSISPPAGASAGTVAVTTGSWCNWTAVSNNGWITVTGGASGTGSGTVSYSVAANSGGARTGTVTIAGQTFTVTQAAAACSYSIDPTSISPPAGGATGTVAATAGSWCNWTAVSNNGWITVTGGASGTGNGTVSYSVAVNSGGVRTGTITIAGQTFTVYQSAAACSYSIDPTSISPPAGASAGMVAVTTGSWCNWTAVSNNGWITVTGGASGTGNGTVSYSVAANSAGARTGTITIAGQTFTVYQSAAACSCSIDPTSISAPAGGATGTVAVTTDSWCNWIAVCNDAWITVTGGASGTGNGTTSYSVAASTGAARTGTCTIAEQTFTVNQAETLIHPAALTLTPLSQGVLKLGDTVEVQPSWRNDGTTPTADMTGTGTASNGGTIVDDAASYGVVGIGATASCAGESDCYSLTASGPRPANHWDVKLTETLSEPASHEWLLHVGDSFSDVPRTSGYFRFIETLLHHSVTGGCTATTYCPGNSATRGQMAIFALVGKEGSSYAPPACGAAPMFTDVPVTSPFCKWVEELARRGIAGGCGGGNYCPSAVVTRGQMPIFMLKTLDPAFDPPACTTPMFGDVPATSPYCKWVEELARRGVVNGCGGGNYCPTNPVTRAQMGVFISATFGLTLYGP
jgi:M6 family metalloprotease-like protein